MKKKPVPSTPATFTPFVEPSYFKKLGLKPSNRKVGQTFVISVKKPLPKTKDS